MAIRVIGTSRTSPGTVYDLPQDGQTIQVLTGVVISASNGGTAFYLPGNGNTLIVEGTLRAHVATNMGDSPADSGSLVQIGATGLSDGVAIGVMLRGSGRIENAGRIEGDDTAIYAFANADRRIDIVNSGTMDGQWYGIFASNFEGDNNLADTRVTNEGTIRGAVASIRLGVGDDVVVNRGSLDGQVLLRGGHDIFDNRGGTLANGTISLGWGADILRPGAGAETAYGGSGLDTLDFRSGGAVSVNLSQQAENTGVAANDRYSGFERVWGSTAGGDTITGNAAANTLMGWGGKDEIAGGGGDDRLVGGSGWDLLRGGAGDDQLLGGYGGDRLLGGLGADTLTGGQGADRFVFTSAAQGGDTITDFSRSQGDRIVIDASAFGGGLAEVGSPTSDQFAAQGSNLAATADVRFIFRTGDATLWFDANGNAAGGRTLLADLQAGASLEATDILLI